MSHRSSTTKYENASLNHEKVFENYESARETTPINEIWREMVNAVPHSVVHVAHTFKSAAQSMAHAHDHVTRAT